MNVEAGWQQDICGAAGLFSFDETRWMDGDDGQEDELDDVHKGILDAPTDSEGAGEINESNKGDVELEKQDEMAGVPQPPSDPDEKKEFPGF